MSKPDVVNTLRGGWLENIDFIAGSHRYTIRSNHMFVVIAVRSHDCIVAVTCWRNDRD